MTEEEIQKLLDDNKALQEELENQKQLVSSLTEEKSSLTSTNEELNAKYQEQLKTSIELSKKVTSYFIPGDSSNNGETGQPGDNKEPSITFETLFK